MKIIFVNGMIYVACSKISCLTVVKQHKLFNVLGIFAALQKSHSVLNGNLCSFHIACEKDFFNCRNRIELLFSRMFNQLFNNLFTCRYHLIRQNIPVTVAMYISEREICSLGKSLLKNSIPYFVCVHSKRKIAGDFTF